MISGIDYKKMITYSNPEVIRRKVLPPLMDLLRTDVSLRCYENGRTLIHINKLDRYIWLDRSGVLSADDRFIEESHYKEYHSSDESDHSNPTCMITAGYMRESSHHGYSCQYVLY